MDTSGNNGSAREVDVHMEDDGLTIEDTTHQWNPNAATFRPLHNPAKRNGEFRANVCFANSVTQCLLALPSVQDWIRRTGTAVSPIRAALQEIENGNTNHTLDLIDAVMEGTTADDLADDFSDGRQHDALEFFYSMLAQEPDLRGVFEFYRLETRTCTNCRCAELCQAGDVHRCLVIQRPLQQASGQPQRMQINELIANELNSTRMQRCNKIATCKGNYGDGVNHEIKGQLRLLTCNVLCIRIKIFARRTENGPEEKSNAEITITDDLELDGERWSYTAAILHRGNSIESGHYRAYTRHGDRWLLKDDSRSFVEPLPNTLKRTCETNPTSLVYTLFLTRKLPQHMEVDN